MQTKSTKHNTIAQVWSQPNCSACETAKQLLQQHQIPHQVCEIGDGYYTKQMLFEMLPSVRSVPQIFINGFHIGGLQQLHEWLNDNNQRTQME